MEYKTITPKGAIRGEIIPPGDKSISHRAIIFSALADGKSTIENFLESEDCLSTVEAFKAMGVSIEKKQKYLCIDGVGLNGLCRPKDDLFVGNSGTTMRLLSGILAAQSFDSTLDGDESLRNRPMDRIVEPLRKMGAVISGNRDRHHAPLHIHGTQLKGIRFEEKRGSAQVKSCVLLAGLYADKETIVHEIKPSRDHTERMLSLFNARFVKKGELSTIKKTESLKSQRIHVPGDISSAAFFIVAALLLKGSELKIINVGLNPSRIGVLKVLREMGAAITITDIHGTHEPYGTITVKGSELHGIKINQAMIPAIIDELPIIMVAAACAKGETVIKGAEELRVKETDRLKSMCSGLKQLGSDVHETKDGAIIQGGKRFKGNVTLDSCNDHRTAMSLAIAGLHAEQEIAISNPDSVSISYPDFFNTINNLTQ
ncbi:MAG: 3-phosphoshikimate 1-carboxyvinyltransferase [Candidatus Omnitrophica bacterium]|nr:3-phosphoshikimate 1-carboxyvinyltransferase [Candidatus Omnitrophota bacterium]